MQKKYKFKSGSVLPVKAEIVGQEIERIKEKNNGRLMPEDILKSAESSKSVLHKCFDWNDSSAAKKYRLQQAKYLIRSVEVIYVGDDGSKSKPVRAFVTLIEEGIHKPRSYMTIGEVMGNKALKARYLSELLWEYENLAERNSDVKEFMAIHAEIKRTRKKIKKKLG